MCAKINIKRDGYTGGFIMKDIKIIDMRVQPGDSAFLIDDSETAILYDSGFGFTGFALAEKLKNYLGRRPLNYIFLTHSHYDHALGSAYVLVSYPEAKVTAGVYAAAALAREKVRQSMKQLDNSVARERGIEDYEFLGENLRTDIAVEDGDVIEAGSMRFRTVALPGHTKCSVAFYEENRGLLLSCESLGLYDAEKTIIPAFLTGVQMTFDSIDKAKGLSVNRLLLPHEGILSERQTAFYMENIRPQTEEAVRFIADHLERGVSDPDITESFRLKYRRGGFVKTYPKEAMDLNTSIMIKLIKKEILRW